tara:strand:+ start:104 stop:394 length:291 start_codon:yes stop_codon:yes gene_type:complete
MKINEQVHHDTKNDKIIVESTYDNNPTLERAEQLRKAKVGITGHNKLVGTIPIHIVKMWCTEAGIKWSDTEAKREIIRKKILSGDFDKLRVWKGTF